MRNAYLLIALADQLDEEGKLDKADIIDENFEEFLELLEEGKLNFDSTFPAGSRDPRLQRSNFGRETQLCGISGPQ